MLRERKNQLIIVVSLLLTMGFLVTSLASYYVSRASLRKQISQNELPLTSDNIYSEIQRDLLSSVFISSLMANNTFLRDWVILGEQDSARITRYLKEIQNKYDTFTSFLVSEKSRVYYHGGGILKTVREGEARDNWYFRVRQMKQDYEINVDPDLANQDAMTVFVNYRVYDYEGRYIGATGVGLTVGAVRKLIDKYQRTYGRNIFFTDKKGLVVLHGQVFADSVNNIRDIEQLAPMADAMLSRPGGYYQYKGDNGICHLSTRYIPELDWYLWVEQTEAGAVRRINQALMVNLGICAAITLVVLLLTNLTISMYQSRLERMAATDKLTGAYNRQAFDIVLNQSLKDAKRRGAPLSVIMLDMDHFKQINDVFGHLAGDAVLRNAVQIMSGAVRESDVLCRWGGEEFLVLLNDCGLDDAFGIGEKIRMAVRTSVTVHQGLEIPVTISLGLAQYEEGESPESLISRADQAMYDAKAQGRNRSVKRSAETPNSIKSFEKQHLFVGREAYPADRRPG